MSTDKAGVLGLQAAALLATRHGSTHPLVYVQSLDTRTEHSDELETLRRLPTMSRLGSMCFFRCKSEAFRDHDNAVYLPTAPSSHKVSQRHHMVSPSRPMYVLYGYVEAFGLVV